MWRIQQTAEGWVVTGPNGFTATLVGEDAYGMALALLGAQAAEQGDVPATGTSDEGLLPERWVDLGEGIALRAPTGPYRDFSRCAFSWRDPAATLVPLMDLTEASMGHFGAQLAGFVDEFLPRANGAPGATGRFYDTEVGRAFRDRLLGGRIFGVSVDPSENVEAEVSCVEYDDEGYCMAERVDFTAYEIAGLTGVPFPGFDRTAIRLDGAEGVTAAAHEDCGCGGSCGGCGTPPTSGRAVVAAASVGVPHLRRQWFLGVADDEPVTPMEGPDDDGHVFGCAGLWGSCHIGRADKCVNPPRSASGYAHYHLGMVEAEGERVPVGAVVMDTGHASLDLSPQAAASHYDDTGRQALNVHVVDAGQGIFYGGVASPALDAVRMHVLRACGGVSGDWREIPRYSRRLEMVGLLAVNIPGFTVPRSFQPRGALAASAAERFGNDAVYVDATGDAHRLAAPDVAAREEGGRVVALVAAGTRAVAAQARRDPVAEKLDDALARLARIEEAFGPELHDKLARRYLHQIASA